MHYQKTGWVEYSLLALLGALTLLSAVLLLAEALVPEAIRLPGITIDRLSTVIALLVAGVGITAYGFSLRYLDGEPGQRQFLRWLFFTVCMAYLLIFSTNLLLLFAAWFCTSMGLHRLLTFYSDRPEAQRPARKKFLISRLGDLVLLLAIFLIWVHWNTLDLPTFLANVNTPVTWSWAPTVVALLIVNAALAKSAQFPFHSWLPETMEAPTPVSALMHAGIINAGGVLLLRFAPLLATEPVALSLLVLVGTLTMTFGMLTMWAQTNVKRTLAWSTVSQMGFMMIQLGLAVFPAAILHIVGHGFYKAWSFFRTGDLPDVVTLPAHEPPRRAFGYGLLGVAVAVPALALAALITSFNPFHSPGELALTTLVALGIGQFWLTFFRAPVTGADAALTRNLYAVLTTFALALLAFLLYKGASIFFAPVVGPTPVLSGPLAWMAALLPVLAFVLLSVVQILQPVWRRTPRGRAFAIHALHGFYFGILADRLVATVWQSLSGKGESSPIKQRIQVGNKNEIKQGMKNEVEYA
ncbi:MAG: oxidoreductase [Caldilinea sp. CFX5]|nr:oxidoreductase [Caldilinea sp. CFX5]